MAILEGGIRVLDALYQVCVKGKGISSSKRERNEILTYNGLADEG